MQQKSVWKELFKETQLSEYLPLFNIGQKELNTHLRTLEHFNLLTFDPTYQVTDKFISQCQKLYEKEVAKMNKFIYTFLIIAAVLIVVAGVTSFKSIPVHQANKIAAQSMIK